MSITIINLTYHQGREDMTIKLTNIFGSAFIAGLLLTGCSQNGDNVSRPTGSE